VGAWLREALERELSHHGGVVEIRGQGLMIGIELAVPCSKLSRRALDQGLLINVTNDRVIRLLPPLIFTQQQAQLLVDTLAPLVRAFLAEQAASTLEAA
jgi:acetylornithine aminotransferase